MRRLAPVPRQPRRFVPQIFSTIADQRSADQRSRAPPVHSAQFPSDSFLAATSFRSRLRLEFVPNRSFRVTGDLRHTSVCAPVGRPWHTSLGELAGGFLDHWKLAEKLNNYLNICWIGKSSTGGPYTQALTTAPLPDKVIQYTQPQPPIIRCWLYCEKMPHGDAYHATGDARPVHPNLCPITESGRSHFLLLQMADHSVHCGRP
jgi:hypothetical protein